MNLNTKNQKNFSSNDFLYRDVPVKDVIIFGLKKMSEVAWYFLTHDSPYRVVAFTVDEAYCTSTKLHGLPVVPFEKLTTTFPPGEFGMHLPIGWKEMNALRARKLAQASTFGYPIVSYVSSRAVVCADLRMGANCEIHSLTYIGPFSRIGEDCLLYANTTIGHHCVIGNHCYVAGQALVCGGATIGDWCVLGANCTILNGVKVAPNCFIAAGAVVTRDTDENGLYMGIPARRAKVSADRIPVVM